MKTAVRAIGLLCVLHVLALLGGVGWLAATQRLNQERLTEAVELFRPTIPEEKAKEKEAEAEEVRQDAERHADRAERAAGAEEPAPRSAAAALADRQRGNEVTMRRIERARAEVERLRDQLEAGQREMEKQREALAEKRKAFEKRLKEVEKKKNEEGFKQAVRLYESLPSDQVKNMFMSMIEEGQTDQVVAYLEAMQTRTAGKVLEEFETPDELSRAVELTERLRQRGSDLADELENVG